MEKRKKKPAAKSLTAKEMKKVKGGRALATTTATASRLDVGATAAQSVTGLK